MLQQRRDQIYHLTGSLAGFLDLDALLLLRRVLRFAPRLARDKTDTEARAEVETVLERIEDELAERQTVPLPASEDDQGEPVPEKVAGAITNGTGV